MRARNVFVSTAAMVLLASASYGQAFSVVNGGPQGLPGDFIYNPGPTPPNLFLPGTGAFEVDALSANAHGIPEGWAFSVDINSLGAPGTAVNTEAMGGDQPADIYTSGVMGLNTLAWDGNGSTAPGLGLAEPGPVPVGDDVDGLELHGYSGNLAIPSPPGAVYYSLSQASAAGLGLDGAFLFMDPAITGYDFPTPFAASFQLGLLGGGLDDLDAVVVLDGDGIFDPGDQIFFSLTPGSATLGLNGWSAADILVSQGGAVNVAVPSGALGLLPTDNIDALDVIPEPSSILLLAAGGLILFKVRRYFRI